MQFCDCVTGQTVWNYEINLFSEGILTILCWFTLLPYGILKKLRLAVHHSFILLLVLLCFSGTVSDLLTCFVIRIWVYGGGGRGGEGGRNNNNNKIEQKNKYNEISLFFYHNGSNLDSSVSFYYHIKEHIEEYVLKELLSRANQIISAKTYIGFSHSKLDSFPCDN